MVMPVNEFGNGFHILDRQIHLLNPECFCYNQAAVTISIHCSCGKRVRSMKIWLVRHGQTDLNKAKKMQGRSDIPLNETGIAQAEGAAKRAAGVHFDAVYASPLDRAVTTAAIIAGISKNEVCTDERIIETDFGKYEQRSYYLLGPAMTLYWALPEVFPAPRTVETISSMVERSSSFLRDLEKKSCENVLVSCHGGIIRALSGYLEGRPNGVLWRPKPHNCEFRVYEKKDETWKKLQR